MNDNTDSGSAEQPADTQSPCAEAKDAKPAEGRDDFYLDWFERYLIAGSYCWLVVRLWNDYLEQGSLTNLLLVPSEGLVLLFTLIRHPSRAVTRQPIAWLVAFGAGLVPLMVAPVKDVIPILNFGGDQFVAFPILESHAGGVKHLLTAAALDLRPVNFYLGGIAMMLGLVLQIHAKITLARSFGCVPAHRGLKLTGPYRFVRHPMYASYLITYLGFLSMNPSLWNLGVYCLWFALVIPRLRFEERLLSDDPIYREYQAVVPYRLIPGLF